MTQRNDFGPRLRAAAQALSIDMDDHQGNALIGYLDLLQRWNRTYNLTALRDPEQMLIQHLFDSLAVVEPLREVLDKTTGSGTVVDVGSGAGLPGIVLAIMRPDISVHCVDTVEKKATFIRYVSGALRLPSLHAHHARIEAMPPLNATVVISRAFASLTDFASLSGVHVGEQGHLVAMKGRNPEEEVADLQANTSWGVDRIETLDVPELDAQRCLVWLTKQGITR